MEASSITGVAAAGIALVHTLAGPDHYVPFIALARANNWSTLRLVVVTLACGLAHVLSSVILGLAAAMAGLALTTLESVRDTAGTFAGYGFVILGGLYALWGLWRALRHGTHTHIHLHGAKGLHIHSHTHHPEAREHHGTTPDHSRPVIRSSTWLLFLIFAFGPCEPLIAFSFPLGLEQDWSQLASIALVFSLVTLATMTGLVLLAHKGLARVHIPGLERYVHVLAGLAILASGGAIVWLGL